MKRFRPARFEKMQTQALFFLVLFFQRFRSPCTRQTVPGVRLISPLDGSNESGYSQQPDN